MNNRGRHAQIVSDPEEEELFWEDMESTVGCIIEYYMTYIFREPCMNSSMTGQMWLAEVMNGHERRSINVFRMNATAFQQLCDVLHNTYGLRTSQNISIQEQVAMFVYTIAKGRSNRDVQERFQHSGETVSRHFHIVMNAVLRLAQDLIKPTDPNFREIPSEIQNDTRYMPYFKDCIGAIDGTHIYACIPPSQQIPFIGRKGLPTQNIMVACSFDMQFTFALAGWEGSTHDARIFYDALNRPELNFPKPPKGKYYVVDAGYPLMEGYLGPYRRTRYHLPDFERGGPPRGLHEMFNKSHSSLRGCVERTIGVWKRRFKILERMPPYDYDTQRNIVIASIALHNYLRRNTIGDPIFTCLDQNPNFIPPDIFPDVPNADNIYTVSDSQALRRSRQRREMEQLRDNIAAQLMENTR